MDVIAPAFIAVSEDSRVGEARRIAQGLASQIGFDETRAGEVALVATEAATNLVRHATGGEILLRGEESGGRRELEMVALDTGPGMADLPAHQTDGYSSAGTRGVGLGAIHRVASAFDIHSTPGTGTVLVARFFEGDEPATNGAVRVGGVSGPRPGETACGDAWISRHDAEATVVMVVDGLGHGPEAAAAAAAAVTTFEKRSRLSPGDIVGAVHDALRATRGAAVAVARIDPPRAEMLFCGVGNIAGALIDATGSRHLVSLSGTAGHHVHKVQEFRYPWPERGWLVMHSDGIATRWSLDAYAGHESLHPLLLAGLLYRDHRRGRDDATVVVVRGEGLPTGGKK